MFKKLLVNIKAAIIVFIIVIAAITGYFISVGLTIASMAIGLFILIKLLFTSIDNNDLK